jgi:hypothetical protein
MEQALQKVTSIAPPVTETYEEEQEQKFTARARPVPAVKTADYTKAAATKRNCNCKMDDSWSCLISQRGVFTAPLRKGFRTDMQSIWLKRWNEYMHSSIPQPLSDPNRS